MTKEKYIKHKEILAGVNHGIKRPEIIIEELINDIIKSMYIPVPDERQFIVCPILPNGIDKDPINWANLVCVEVVYHGEEEYTATIEEASPETSNLCRYVENLLISWGWNVTVECRW